MLAMLGALLYQAFDIHDTQPFGVDPELPLFMLGAMLLFCIGVAVMVMRRLDSSVPLSKVPSFLRPMESRSTVNLGQAFDIERLLFSPPLAVLSLRV